MRLNLRIWRQDGPDDKGRLVATTFDNRAVDGEPFAGAKRFYAVFVNVGPTEAAARGSRS